MTMNSHITGFKSQGRRNKRIEVFLDGESWAVLDPETVVRENLRDGEALPPQRQVEVLATDEAIAARKAAAGSMARSPKTRREIRRRLAERGFSSRAVERAIETLCETGTLDDTRTAERHVRGRRRGGDMGPRRIRTELVGRGIDPGEAERLVREATEGVDLVAECLALARRARGRYEPLSEPKQRQKLIGYLTRRGYEGETIQRAMGCLLNEVGVDDER